MSIWTHVAATIRYDDLRAVGGLPGARPELGKVVTFDHLISSADPVDTFIPRGSEGSLEWLFHENPRVSALSSYTVAIWGDLRDFDEVDEVIAYLTRITKGALVRQGIAEIGVEGQEPVVVRHVHEQGWVRVR